MEQKLKTFAAGQYACITDRGKEIIMEDLIHQLKTDPEKMLAHIEDLRATITMTEEEALRKCSFNPMPASHAINIALEQENVSQPEHEQLSPSV